jgi:HEPN domain-containing protein
MKRATRAWVRKAETDHRAAEKVAAGSDPLHDQTCFHCQQCAEKYFKALLEELGHHIPKTPDLDHLVGLLLPSYSALHALRRRLVFLNQFAVDTRYPGKSASKRQAVSAYRWAGHVRDACRALLGLRPPRRRRP